MAREPFAHVRMSQDKRRRTTARVTPRLHVRQGNPAVGRGTKGDKSRSRKVLGIGLENTSGSGPKSHFRPGHRRAAVFPAFLSGGAPDPALSVLSAGRSLRLRKPLPPVL